MVSILGKLAGATGEARARAKADADQRAAAGSAEKSVILNPQDVRGDYDVARLLTTTLGGKMRAMTSDDLAAFRHNAKLLGNRFKGGITPRNVIDMSEAEDRKRARLQITMAVPAAARGVRDSSKKVDRLEVRFITNASKDSEDTRHYVMVEFMGYPAAVASGAMSAGKAAALMRKQNVRFDCDCGRHRYWFRYLATIGNYNAGRAETGYPKIRNPNLAGMACKHVLRVMTEIEASGLVLSFLTRAIEKGRQSEDGAGAIRTSQKEADKQAAKQAARPKVRAASSGDRDFERAAKALRKLSRATYGGPKKQASGSRKAGAASESEEMMAMMQGFIAKHGIKEFERMAAEAKKGAN